MTVNNQQPLNFVQVMVRAKMQEDASALVFSFNKKFSDKKTRALFEAVWEKA